MHRGREEADGLRDPGQFIGRIVSVNRDPDALRLRVRTSEGDVLSFTDRYLCPCLEAIAELMGEKILTLPHDLLRVFELCVNRGFLACRRYHGDCGKGHYLQEFIARLDGESEWREGGPCCPSPERPPR